MYMESDEDLQPLFLLSDEPIGASGDDGLGMNQTARVIAEDALGAATPFTVVIFGAWGHGRLLGFHSEARALQANLIP